MLSQAGVGIDLLVNCPAGGKNREPAPHLFFISDNGGRNVAGVELGKSCSELSGSSTTPVQNTDVIGIQKNHLPDRDLERLGRREARY